MIISTASYGLESLDPDKQHKSCPIREGQPCAKHLLEYSLLQPAHPPHKTHPGHPNIQIQIFHHIMLLTLYGLHQTLYGRQGPRPLPPPPTIPPPFNRMVSIFSILLGQSQNHWGQVSYVHPQGQRLECPVTLGVSTAAKHLISPPPGLCEK